MTAFAEVTGTDACTYCGEVATTEDHVLAPDEPGPGSTTGAR
jgi:hypothetical protein